MEITNHIEKYTKGLKPVAMKGPINKAGDKQHNSLVLLPSSSDDYSELGLFVVKDILPLPRKKANKQKKDNESMC